MLDPGIELFDPTGNLIPHTNVAGDESLTHTALTTGSYAVRLFSEANNGAYVLNVDGRSTSLPTFDVAATNPFDGQILELAPAEIVVDFDSPVLLTSVDAGDLTIDGVAAQGVTIVDGNTLSFQIDSLDNGTYAIEIAAGALTNLQGAAIEPFSSQFVLDLSRQIIDNETVDIARSVRSGSLAPGSDTTAISI